MKSNSMFPAVFIFFLIYPLLALAEIPHCINYQGLLNDSTGTPVTSGIYSVKFTIYGSESGSDELWSSGYQSIQVTSGVFTYLLGSNMPFEHGVWETDSTRYLGITISPNSELTPRVKLTSAPYAYHSALSDALALPAILEASDGVGPILNVTNTGEGTAIYGESSGGYAGYFEGSGYFAGDLTVGGSLISPGLGDITEVAAGSGLTGGGATGAVELAVANGGINSSHIQNNAIVNDDIYTSAAIAPGKIDGTAAVLNGDNIFTGSNNFNSFLALNDNDFILARGGYARWHLNETGTGGLKIFQAFDNNDQYVGRTVMEFGDEGTVGIGNTVSYSKLRIEWSLNSSQRMDGLCCLVTNQSTGTIYGGGFYALNYTSGGGGICYGIEARGTSDADYRYGIMCAGEAYNSYTTTGYSYGLYGSAYNGAVAYGVYGSAVSATTNWAGYFHGNCRVTGTFDNSKSTMRIDHPLDPENKTLEHAGINSPEMLNVYCGNVTTDTSGMAVVELPEYFESLNSDYRYQLTVFGSFAQAIIKEKITGNRFVIATSEPEIEVSWLVAGVRRDAYAQANPVVTEREKSPEERGTFINPEAFGYDITRSAEYAVNPELRREYEKRNGR